MNQQMNKQRNKHNPGIDYLHSASCY